MNTRPDRVTLFASCMVDQLAPSVGESTVKVLEYLGINVDFVYDQTCCGQPAFNSGFRSDAMPVAERFLELFEKVAGIIVVPSGSCAGMLREHYPRLFSKDLDWRARADRHGTAGLQAYSCRLPWRWLRRLPNRRGNGTA